MSSSTRPAASPPARRVGYRNHNGRDSQSLQRAERAIARRSAAERVLDPDTDLHADEISPGMRRTSIAALWEAVAAVTVRSTVERHRLGLPGDETAAVRHIVRAGHRLGIGDDVEHAVFSGGGRAVREALVEFAQTVSVLELLYLDAGKRDRRIVQRLLAHPDTPERLHRELSEEAALRAAHKAGDYPHTATYAPNRRAESAVRSWEQKEAARTLAHRRLMRELAAEAGRLSVDVGCTSSVIAILETAGLRQLLARLIRHERNMRQITEAGTPGRASRAKILFERSWENAVTRARKQVEDKVLILPPGPPGYRYNNTILATERRAGEILDEGDETAPAGADHPSSENSSVLGVFWTKLGVAPPDSLCGCDSIATLRSAAAALLDDGGGAAPPGPIYGVASAASTCLDEADTQPAATHGATSGVADRPSTCLDEADTQPTGAEGATESGPEGRPGRAALRAEAIVKLFSGRPAPVAECDLAGVEIWSDGDLLLEILVAHTKVPDRLLAGVKRASARSGGHMNPNPPVTPQQLLFRLGAAGTAQLMQRLRTVRVQWPKGEQPPRYIRHPVSRVEWRTAARFLIHEGSEAAWLTSPGVGGVHVDALMAGCMMLETCDVTTSQGRERYLAARESCAWSAVADANIERLAPGRDVLVEAAQCVMLLGLETLAEYDREELTEILYAAGGYDLTHVNVALAAVAHAPRGRNWEAASAVLAAQLTDHELEAALKLLHNWEGTLSELIEIVQHL
jgi:hypothetical protein